MKKLILSLSLIMAVSFAFAQKSNVSLAEKLATQDSPDFKAARKAIQEAMKDPTTMNDAKTYYIAGLIGEKENEDLYKKLTVKAKIDTVAKGKAIMESIKYYLIADSLDNLPDAKGKVKPKYEKKIVEALKFYYGTQNNLFDYAAYLYDKRDFKPALEAFKAYLSIPQLPMMKSLNLPESAAVKYYAGYAARSIPDYDEAIKLYTELKTDTFRTDDVYQLLATEYLAKGDTADYVVTLKEGFEKFKEQPWYLQTLINYYIFSGKLNEALTYLENAVAQSPDKAEYYAVKGNIEERLDKIDEARADFDKALELDPGSASANAGIGRLLFNQGVKMSNDANDIKDNAQYNIAKAKADEEFKKALPYLQKAVELNSKDADYKFALRQLYYRLDMQKEYDEISKEMGGE